MIIIYYSIEFTEIFWSFDINGSILFSYKYIFLRVQYIIIYDNWVNWLQYFAYNISTIPQIVYLLKYFYFNSINQLFTIADYFHWFYYYRFIEKSV